MSTPAEVREVPAPPSFLATRKGKLTLAFLCMVGFLDFVDASIVNVALPTIRHDLHFSVQNLQWVLSGYLLTYGGFMLLGGRAADLLGRRRILIGGIAGLASALGVFLGGVLTEDASWRWIFWVNLPVSALLLIATFRMVSGERDATRTRNFDSLGAFLVTGGMLLLVYALVKAPDQGWGSARTIAELVGAAALLLAFIVNERLHANPLAPLSIFRINGLGAANATQVVAIGAFYAMFFLITLYMQNVLGYSQLQAGSAYLPATAGVAISSGIASQLFSRTGTRPIIVTGALISAGAIYWLSRIPVHGSYLENLLPGLMIMSFGLGFVFVGVNTAANAGVPADKAGLAAALVNTSTWVGGAFGLAIFSVIATSRTNDLLARAGAPPDALTAGFNRALLACSIFLIAAAAIAFRATNTRGEPAAAPALEAVPAAETI